MTSDPDLHPSHSLRSPPCGVLGSARSQERWRWWSDEEGAGTVLALAVVAVVLVLVGWLVLLAGAQSARGRAQAAADLGALAGAQLLLAGTDACGVAGRTVRRNRATLAVCEATGSGVVHVEVTVRTVLGAATAEARAGPRDADGGAS